MNLLRFLIRIPLIGRFVRKWVLDTYKPLPHTEMRTAIGPYGENMGFEPLAQTRDEQHWLFKVYTSEKALKEREVMTTIYMENRLSPIDYFLSEEQRDRFIETQFKMAQDAYNAFMDDNFTPEERQKIADAVLFDVNATGMIATADGTEIPVDEYLDRQERV